MDDNVRRQNETEEDVVTDEQEVVDLEEKVDQELQQAKELATQFENNYKRAVADYQNLQRRTQEEKREWIRMANKDIILKFLPVLDTLMLAAKHIQDKGLNMSIDQFLRVLSDEGIEKIATVGQEFDPRIMEAVTTQEVKDKKGEVVEEVRAGYIFADTVLRAAQVIVGK